MIKKLNDYEYSILDEIRRDEINQAIEKANLYDSICDSRDKYMVKLEQENKKLQEELRNTQQNYEDECSDHEETKTATQFYIREESKQRQQLEMYDATRSFKEVQTEQRLEQYKGIVDKFTNMVYHAECGRLPVNWITSGRSILDKAKGNTKLSDGDAHV